jgi:hypothetical protein
MLVSSVDPSTTSIVVPSIDTPTVVHCIGPSLFRVAVADTAGDCKPYQQPLFVSSSLTFVQLLPSSTLSPWANTSDSSVECYKGSYSRWIRTFDAFMHCSFWRSQVSHGSIRVSHQPSSVPICSYRCYRCYDIRFKLCLSFNSWWNIWSINAVHPFWINTTA